LIVTRSPLRITLGGGGTDIPFFYKKYGAAFVSASINKHVYVAINKIRDRKYTLRYSNFEDISDVNSIKHPIIREAIKLLDIKPGIEITSFADIPSGTGLGSSGAFSVALIKALSIYKKENISQRDLAKIASKIEIEILKENVGLQDTYCSALGSLRFFKINKAGVVSSTDLLKANPDLKKHFKNFYLINTNVSRNANDELKNTIFLKDKNFIENNLLESKKIGIESRNLLENYSNLASFSSTLTNQWKVKLKRSPSKFHKNVNKTIVNLIELGAAGGKLIGAGGGGFILIYSKPSNFSNIRDYLKSENLSYFNLELDTKGTTHFEL